MNLVELVEKLREFARGRDWEQFHSPKNLSMALSVEVAELLEHFQWLTEEQSASLDADDLAAVSDAGALDDVTLALRGLGYTKGEAGVGG